MPVADYVPSAETGQFQWILTLSRAKNAHTRPVSRKMCRAKETSRLSVRPMRGCGYMAYDKPATLSRRDTDSALIPTCVRLPYWFLFYPAPSSVILDFFSCILDD